MISFMDQFRAMDRRRKSARITSEELAEEAGVSAVTLSRWRNNKQRPGVDGWATVIAALERLIVRRAMELERLK
jgi:transcriptional regulator with XRE-family HTH domain